jgi:hypothetical protein
LKPNLLLEHATLIRTESSNREGVLNGRGILRYGEAGSGRISESKRADLKLIQKIASKSHNLAGQSVVHKQNKEKGIDNHAF